MAWHHIIPKHEWLVRFGNLNGFNAPDNQANLTNEQHAEVHAHYFNEITHIEYDRIAGLVISGQIGKEEAIKQAVVFANTGNTYCLGIKHPPRSEYSKQLYKERALGNTYRKGKHLTPEAKQKLLDSGTCFPSGHSPWNKGLAGVQIVWNKGVVGVQRAWNKGVKRDEVSKLAQSVMMMGKKRGPYKKRIH